MSETVTELKRPRGRPKKTLTQIEPGAKLSYTIDEAAEATGVSETSIYDRIREGDLTTFKWCGRTLIRADVLKAAIDRASGRGPGHA